MKNIWKYLVVSAWLVMLPVLFSCSDANDDAREIPVVKPDVPMGDGTDYYTKPECYASFFAYNVLNDVYLWKKEVATELEGWQIDENPIAKLKEIRYKDELGREVDKWSMVTDDYASFIGGVDGVSTTYGYDFQLYWKDDRQEEIVAVVTFTYADGPAREAGLKRGDAIFTVDGAAITLDNYEALLYSDSVELGVLNEDNDGLRSVSMTAVNMYEDPVLMDSIYLCGPTKVGYLAYTSFTLESCGRLIDVCRRFKQRGVTELILDLRYNGGGYVVTENLLASMLAPEKAVQGKQVFETEIWNDDYMAYYESEGEDLNTYFQTVYKFKDHNQQNHSYSTADANIGLNKIYALVSGSTASASESILVGLMPYLDIEIIGMQTHGKYCTGKILSATDWFSSVEKQLEKNGQSMASEFPEFRKWESYAHNWGIYVMINRYADRDGNNPCIPDGLTPDVVLEDNPQEPYPLGDDREALLRRALKEAGKADLTALPALSRASSPWGKPLIMKSHRPLDGKRIVMDTIQRDYSLQRVE